MTELEYPPHAVPERETLDSWLDFHRLAVLRKIKGAGDEALRRTMVPSGLTLLGVVKHLCNVERWWFQICFAGEGEPPDYDEDDPDWDFRVEPNETTREIVDGYLSACALSRHISAAASLDDVSKREGRDHTLRWILVHMIEETARHVGHMDIMREQIDGSTGS